MNIFSNLAAFQSERLVAPVALRRGPVGIHRRAVERWTASRFPRWGIYLGVAASVLATGATAAETSLALDRANSHIEIVVTATADSFVGKLADYAPTISLDPATGQVTSARLAFHFKDVKTGNEKRDVEMHAWQQTAKFPDGEFTLGTLAPAAGGKLTANGTLALHGVSHAISFPVTVTHAGTGLVVEGEATVDTRWFGLPPIRKFVVLKVDPFVVVRFHLAGTWTAP